MPVKVAGGVLPMTDAGERRVGGRNRRPAPAAGRSARTGLCPADRDRCHGRRGHSCDQNSIEALLSGCRDSGFGVCGTDGRDLCPPPIWRAARAEEPGKSGQAAGRPCSILSSTSHVRAVAFLLLCGLVLFLPGFFNIPPIDRDEARFAQATKQMVETGDFVDIRFQDEVRYKKPVGIYWLQAAAVETASALGLPRAQVRIWLYRVPSLIGAIGAMLLTYWTALAFVTRRGAILAGLMIGSSVLLGVEARLAKTDAMLLLHGGRGDGGDGAGLSVLAARRGSACIRHGSWPAIFWTALAARHPAQGAADPDVRRADDRHACDPRPLRRHGYGGCARSGA